MSSVRNQGLILLPTEIDGSFVSDGAAEQVACKNSFIQEIWLLLLLISIDRVHVQSGLQH